jgi:glycosyltransferase 2 family protein
MTTEAGSADPPRGPRGVLVTPDVLRHGVRLYVPSKGQPRSRRASDVLLLIPSLIALVAMLIADPVLGTSSPLAAFIDSLPSFVEPVFAFLFDLLTLWAVILIITALARRRRVVLVQALASLVLAVVVAFVASRISSGSWPELSAVFGGEFSSAELPAVRVVQAAVVVLAISPHLTRPWQRLTRWLITLGALSAFVADNASPGGNIEALLIAVIAATAVRIAFGTSAGYPELDEVEAALIQLGVSASELERVDRGDSGAFIARGRDPEGHPLVVKVYGRDAYDNQIIEKIWRTAWYRDPGPGLRVSRQQAVEHEAFVTLLAENAGVPTRQVVTAGTSAYDDALLVLRGNGRPLLEHTAGEFDDRLLGESWKAVRRLGEASIAHRRVDPSSIVVWDGVVGLIDFDGATVSPLPDQIATDHAQLLAATATIVGPDRALAAASASLGPDGLTAIVPYLQLPALGGSLRRALKVSDVDLDELRDEAIKISGAEPPQLAKLRRVTLGTVLQMGLLVLACWTLLSAMSGVDIDQLQSSLQDAVWAWIAVGFVVAQTPRLSQTVSTLGSVAADLPFGPVYAMQLATGYMNLALPSNFARMAINIRFFQRMGVPPAAAVTSGAIDSFANTIIQVVLLTLLLLFSSADLQLQFDVPTENVQAIGLVLVGLLIASVLVFTVIGRLRRAITGRLRQWWPEIKNTLQSLRGSHKLMFLVGGNIMTELLFATALGLFARGLGTHVSISDLLVINIGTSLFATFIPVPGGIGVTEFGLTVGLTGAGMTEEAALATALLYRVSTFYLPPVWGFFAMRWLQKNNHL